MLPDRVTRWFGFLWMFPSFLAPKIPDFNPPIIELLEGTARPRSLDSVLIHLPLEVRQTSAYQVSNLHLLWPHESPPLQGRDTGRSRIPGYGFKTVFLLSMSPKPYL